MAYCSLDEFKLLVRDGRWSYLNERRAFKTMRKLDWTDDNVAEVLLGLSERHDFQKQVRNCEINDFPGQDRIDADQYEIHWNEDEKMGKNSPMGGTVSLSLKIAIAEDVDGSFAGLVSFHLSGSP